jgi:ATP-dependent exoDNAse (exonuclease V) beta subunit
MNELFSQVFVPIGSRFESYEAAPGNLISGREAPPNPAIEIMLVPAETGEETINAEEARIWEARWIAERLLSLERGQQPVWDREKQAYRPFHFSDAAVLFRATTNLPVYEEQFKAAGMPYVTISGRGYFDRPEINDLMALLSAVYNPADDLSLAAALRSPLFCLSDESLYRLRWRLAGNPDATSPLPYAKALLEPPLTDQGEEIEFAAGVLERLWAIARRVPVWALLRQALDLTGYEAALESVDGRGGRRRANVEKLQEIARQNSTTSLSQFLHFVQNMKQREAREGEALGGSLESGEVQLLSIHAAKGLEFPVVCIADMGRTRQGPQASPNLLHDPSFGIACKQRDGWGEWKKPAGYRWAEWLNDKMNLAEDKRLLYVACTRAADLLLLCGRNNNRDTWLKTVLSAWDVPENGDVEAVVERQGYSMRVFRPGEQPGQAGSSSTRQTASGSPAWTHGIFDMLPSQQQPASYMDMTTRNKSRQDSLASTPLAIRNVQISRKDPPTHISRLLRAALDHWDCLAYSPAEIDAFLHRAAGLPQNGMLAHSAPLVQGARRLLAPLIQDPLFQEICQAKTRYTHLPYSCRLAGEVFLGEIDLLYQSGDGGWTIVDWQTGWIDPASNPAQFEDIRERLGRSQDAIKRRLGCDPVVIAVSFNPVFRKELVDFVP